MPTASLSRVLILAPNAAFIRLFLRDSIRTLMVEGHQVMVVTSPETGPQMLEHELGCPVFGLRMARSIDLLTDLRCLFTLRGVLREWQPRMVHAHTPKAGLLGTLAAWIMQVPVRIHTIHGLRSETLTGTRRRVVVAMEQLTARLSTHVLAVSASLSEEVVRAGICPADKLRVLGSGSAAGIALERFDRGACNAQAEAIRAAHTITAEHVLITYIGRLAEDKGLSVLEAAWRQLRPRHPHARLMIAGPHDATDPCDPAMLERLRTDYRVTLLEGFLTNPAPWMAASDLFVQPSFREGLGVAALEASAMEIPVVATRVTGLVDAVDDGVTGLLADPYSAGSLARSLSTLIDAPHRRRQMGLAGRRFVETRFDRKLVTAQLKTFYQFVLNTPPAAHHAFAKRILDFTVALLVLMLASPLMLLCAAAILLTMGGPVFFRQPRAGQHGRVFSVFKFRTMRAPRPDESALGTDVARTTWLGTWMRKLSLDELPQLLNVLRGEMSLVGPRPLLTDYLPRYNAHQSRRHEAKPGITGWAQVHGRNNLGWHERFDHDVWYVDHQSFTLDLKILWMTALKLVRPEGIVPAGQAAMTEFMG